MSRSWSRSPKNIFFDVDIVVKKQLDCGLAWYVLCAPQSICWPFSGKMKSEKCARMCQKKRIKWSDKLVSLYKGSIWNNNWNRRSANSLHFSREWRKTYSKIKFISIVRVEYSTMARWILYNYPPKGRLIVVDIYRDAKRRGIYYT